MNGILILDGPDASGKSTLQEYLVKHHNAIPIHLTYNKDVAPVMFDYQTKAMLEAAKLSETRLVVVDRHWISEQIYAKVFRNGSPWPYMGQMMDRVWRKHAAIYIICLPGHFETAVQRHKDNLDPSHPYPEEKFRELLREYQGFFKRFASMREDFVPYCIEREGLNLKVFCNEVLDTLQHHRTLQYPRALDWQDQNITGHLITAKYLLVGDRVNKKDNYYAWPFFEHRNCSLYLAQLLDKMKVDHTQFMWSNVADEHGQYSYHIQFLSKHYQLKVIVFGRKAEEVLRKTHVPIHAAVAHPQYAKRFGCTDLLVNELKFALEVK